MDLTNFRALYNQARDASNTQKSLEAREPQKAGYAIAPRDIQAHYNVDGSMKEEFKRQYLALGYSAQQINDFESETYQELQALTTRREAYERNYEYPYPVEDLGVDDPPEQVKWAVNRQAIKEGEGLSELPYAIESDQYYDVKAGSRVTPVEEIEVSRLYPEAFATATWEDDSNRF
ncbi:hypothetical protein [Laspinema olomoucense]|uniref:Uncharacterized protein n=1 Tax=Laspinema olomoucense D3b TaxID=2953688 RepID=A0ABT2NFF0_9CYAN|nr:hypothetical protein [Laspinema sp. D3b]MCT7980415.1 hypothetical protein [Laspinema sp. D3b]